MFLLIVMIIWGIGVAIASIWSKTWIERLLWGLLVGIGLVVLVVGVVFAGCMLTTGGKMDFR